VGGVRGGDGWGMDGWREGEVIGGWREEGGDGWVERGGR
jgi:hypothetical protein